MRAAAKAWGFPCFFFGGWGPGIYIFFRPYYIKAPYLLEIGFGGGRFYSNFGGISLLKM